MTWQKPRNSSELCRICVERRIAGLDQVIPTRAGNTFSPSSKSAAADRYDCKRPQVDGAPSKKRDFNCSRWIHTVRRGVLLDPRLRDFHSCSSYLRFGNAAGSNCDRVTNSVSNLPAKSGSLDPIENCSVFETAPTRVEMSTLRQPTRMTNHNKRTHLSGFARRWCYSLCR